MANYHGSLEAVDCNIHSVSYDMSINRGASDRLRCSSGNFTTRRCNDANTNKTSLSPDKAASILSWPTIMGH
eukprot:scaffold58_cov79-Skeletonema_marinoi.AAC.9